jgi:hypothetical protein
MVGTWRVKPSAVILAALACVIGCLGWWPGTRAARAADGTETAAARDPWPRKFNLVDSAGDITLMVYQPQVEKWQGNRIDFRAAVSARHDKAQGEEFGVIWATARTEVDRPAHHVTLEDLKLTRSKFPTLADNGASYLQQLQAQFTGAARTVALDRLEASLAASGSLKAKRVAVRNDPPQIIVSYAPAILVPLSGPPVWHDVSDSRFDRVINTRALIMRTHLDSTCYLHVYDGWLSAPRPTGPFHVTDDRPFHMVEVAEKLIEDKLVDPLDGGDAQPPPLLADGAPAIYVVEHPAELIVFRGQPDLQPIGTTALLWAANTTADVIVDTNTNFYYVLIAGRWFRASSLDGPWSFVAGGDLPADFRRIPPSVPAGVVLASVSGTPQAKEAVIADAIPQTATIPRKDGPTFTPAMDGDPHYKPIAGTTMRYVVNSPTPIIRLADGTYYALQAGVWFTAKGLDGPWAVADEVPAEIYTIPPSSPLYFVTFVRVYGSTPDVVYVGYTPGYLGTVVAPDGTVVYGTGYVYEPWIGTAYYPPPATYGVQAQPVYNPATDMTFGFALGMTTAAMADSWGQPVYYSSSYHGYPCCGSSSADVYGHWSNTAWSGKTTWYSHSDGDIGAKTSGSYTGYRTGTTGSYSGNRYVNPSEGKAGRSYQRSFDTVGGTTGNVNRSETYNAHSGQTDYSANASAAGKGGRTVNRDTSASWGPQGASVDRQTSVYNANTGETRTVGSGYDGNDRYASADGNTYRNDGSGWQKQTANGWQSAAGEDTSWADREQQARSQAQSRFSSFNRGGGGGGWGSRFGGGGGGDGGWGDRFGGGGFGGRFGGRR